MGGLFGMIMRRITAFLSAAVLCFSVFVCNAAADGTDIRQPLSRPEQTVKAAEVLFYGDNIPDIKTNGVKSDSESIVINEEGSAEFVLVADPGEYILQIEYDPLPGQSRNIQLSAELNGKSPSRAAESIMLRRLWRDKDGAQRVDSRGNDIRVPQEEIPFSDRGWLTAYAEDTTGYGNDPIVFKLEKTQTVRLTAVQSALRIRSLKFLQPRKPQSYEEYKSAHSGVPDAQISAAPLEAELAAWKNDKTLAAVSDRSSPATTPSKGAKISLNMIGGEKWTSAGSEIAWNMRVEESGMYEIRLRFRQNYSRAFYSARSLKINGETPFAEAENLRFLYKRSWQLCALGDDSGTPYKFYFEGGKDYTVSLAVTLGDFSGVIERAGESMTALNDIYRQLLMIMSASPDGYRDYNLDELIPETIEEMKNQADKLGSIANEVLEVTGDAGSDLECINKLIVQLRSFAEDTGKIASNLSLFKDNTAALNDWIADIAARPLDIDTVQLAAPGTSVGQADSGFFGRLWYSVKLFFASFAEDYTSIDTLNEECDEVITVWSVSGRDQASVYNDMIRSFYQPASKETYGKTVGVSLQIVAADTILPSLATGNGPDVLMGAGVGQPVDFALRRVAADLRKTAESSELEAVLSRFRESAYIPFMFGDGLYALPEQQTFLVMFYRSDILNQLGIALPTLEQPWTWDTVKSCLPTLQKSNMSILMETGANANTIGLSSFATLLYQRGGSFYNDDFSATALDSETAVDTFRWWTELYNRAGFPAIFNLANRFRTGESPIVIVDFSLYNTLTVSAPEIRGMWDIAPVPGTVREDGTADYSSYSTSTGVIMLEASKHKDAAWDYMKWWTGAEAQTYFGNEMESILGASARYPTANIEAMGNLEWSSGAYRVLTAQAQWAKAVPEVPGGYYLPRYINNAFRNATRETGRMDARESILTYAQVINDEIKQKRGEFGLNS